MAKTYQIMLVAGFVPLDVDLAWDALLAIERADGPCHPLIASFRKTAARHFPDCAIEDDDDDDSEEDSEDCEARFNFTVGVAHIRASIVSPDEEADAQDVIASAIREGLVAFDFRTDQIHRPGGFTDVVLTVENRPFLVGPRLSEVLDVIPTLTPAGGPSFMILARGDDDYVQIAGGDGHFVFERREPAGSGFRHWTAGHHGESANGVISILTHGSQVRVRSNENLSAPDVAALFESFLEGRGRSADYCWRDTTSDFFRARTGPLQ